MAKKRGRRPLPKGLGYSASITLRVPEELRAKLSNAAETKGHCNLSREIVARLNESFGPQRDPEIRALFYLMADALSLIPGNEALRASPYRMAAFTAAVRTILSKLKPRGKIVPPKTDDRDFGKLTKSPEEVGRLVGGMVVLWMKKAPHGGRSDSLFLRARDDLGVPFDETDLKILLTREASEHFAEIAERQKQEKSK